MFSMMEQEKKFILSLNYFFYVVCDGAREKTHSAIICCMLSMMEKEKKLILLKHYFFYPIYDGAR